MTIIDYIQGLSANPYFGAGFGLFGLGAGAAILRKGMQGAVVLFRRHYLITLEVPCRDKSYQWLLQWITEKGARDTRHLSVETVFEESETGLIRTRYDFIPAVGVHYFRYKNNWIKVDRNREQSTIDFQSGMPFEIVKLTALGRDKSVYFDILAEAEKLALKKQENKTVLFTPKGTEWKPFGHPRRKRPLSSVVLDEGVKERILQDCIDFIDNPSWYTDRGIPYRRGYLLYGPPGCGKSSFISALAAELDFGICLLNLSEKTLSDDRLHLLLAIAPQSTIILLEDVDAAFVSREECREFKNSYEGSRVTFSGLLNCIDGVASAEARILFMTTNYVERLDPALIRPGRVDVKEFVGYCSAYQVEQMFKRFYPQLAVHARDFTDVVMSHKKNVSPAQLQGYFMVNKSSGSSVLQNVERIWESG